MDEEGGRLGASLLQWVRSFEEEVNTWNDLSDGRVLWTILHEVDPGYFSGGLPEPDVGAQGDWTRKWQNLKHVEKQISTYYRDICNGQYTVEPDLKGIAADAAPREVERLIMIIIRAAMASPESNQRMAQKLMALGREHAMVIATELRNMDDETDDAASEPPSKDESVVASEPEVEPESTPMVIGDAKFRGRSLAGETYRDPLLEREEELLQAQATIAQLQTNHATMQSQLRDLRSERDRLQEAFDAYRSEIDSKGGRRGGTLPADDDLKKLQRQAENDRAYIDDLENQLTANRTTIDGYERQLDRFRADGDTSQKLKDDLQMLRADNEELTQKLKANENLKKKIQTLQEQEKANATLRDELKQANERLEDADRLRQIKAGLEKEILEKQGLIRNQEYQISELSMTRKNIEYEARVLEKKLEAARERHDRDHETIQALRDRLNENALDEPEIADSTQDKEEKAKPDEAEQRNKLFVPQNDETKNMAEKYAILEKQLEDADARLKQAAQRNATLEDLNRDHEAEAAARQKAESQLVQHEKVISDLRKELETTSRQKAAPAATQDMVALQRENHLMATAWHDLASRLQYGGVVLNRRRQEPKSWIGKQRMLVGPNNSGLQR